MKILIVDDSTTMIRIITNVLNRLSLTDYETALNGEEAFEKWTFATFDKPFDIVVTDWNMPVMTGLELVKKIRIRDKDIPIVMVTTEGGKKEVIRALKAGVNNYIVKPFTAAVLKEKLSKVLGE